MASSWTSQTLGALCLADGEFRLAARFWTGGLRLEIDDRAVGVAVTEIGDFIPGNGKARFVDARGRARKFARPSYSHF